MRTSDNELALAVEEFGEKDTAPFTAAVASAKTTLTQAFNVRQILDDAVPETPQQRRDLLTRVIVAAAKADRELDAQREAFAAAARSGHQRARPARHPDPADGRPDRAASNPREQTLAALHAQFSDDRAGLGGRQRRHRQAAAVVRRPEHHQRPRAGRRGPRAARPGWSTPIRAAESALGQARTLLDAVDSASTDINRAVAGLPAAIADIQNGINAARAQLAQGGVPRADELSAARDAAVDGGRRTRRAAAPPIRWAPSPS